MPVQSLANLPPCQTCSALAADPRARAVRWLIQTIADIPRDDDWLAPAEQDKLASLRSIKRRSDWRLGRWTAKQALTRFTAGTGSAAARLEDLVVGSHANGAACCAMDGRVLPWPISISHSHGRALCAVAPAGTRVGCDLERVEARTAGFTREWFTCSEQETIARARPEQRHLLVTLFWSAKESALKAIGAGLTISTQGLAVSAAEPGLEGDWHVLHVRFDDPEPMLGWWRSDGDDLMTVVTAPGLPQPVWLDSTARQD